MMRDQIMPNDVVLHVPSGEKWVVAGVDHKDGRLIPKGHPFPSTAYVSDCKLLERKYENEWQDAEVIRYFMNNGMSSYVDVHSALAHGWF